MLPPGDLSAVWLGHATVLFRLGGTTLITDPVLSHRIGVRVGPVTLGLERLAPAPVDVQQIPVPRIVLVSHAHFDHLDRPTLYRLAQGQTQVITATNTSRLIPRGFARVQELSPGQAASPEPALRVLALRPRHWGARTFVDRHRGYNSYVISSNAGRVLYAGDTAMTDAFNDLSRDGPLDLAIFGIGGYDPWIHNHANPEQVWEMFRRSGARYLLPIHHSTFKLSDEHPDEPMRRLLNAAGDAAWRIVGRTLGAGWALPARAITATG